VLALTPAAGVFGGNHKPLVRGDIGVVPPEGDAVPMQAGPAGARLVLIGGLPLREPVAKYGPVCACLCVCLCVLCGCRMADEWCG
jgi:redox-sensitive bicupin YhaK (pirin superfamily)